MFKQIKVTYYLVRIFMKLSFAQYHFESQGTVCKVVDLIFKQCIILVMNGHSEKIKQNFRQVPGKTHNLVIQRLPGHRLSSLSSE